MPDKHLRTLARRLLCLPDGWDLPPELGMLYAPNGPGERLLSRAVSLPRDLWDEAPPHEVVGRITAVLASGDDRARADSTREAMCLAFRGFVTHRPGWCGVYLLHEGYSAPEHMTMEILRREEAGGSIGSFAEMEGSEEIRILNLALTSPLVEHDDVFMGRLRRSDNKVVLTGDVPALAESWGGRVPDALLGLLATLKPLAEVQPQKGHA